VERLLKSACFGVLLLPIGLVAQESTESEGFHWGPVLVRPEASVLEAYDDRVRLNAAGAASSDFYTEAAAGVSLNNLSARYDLSADVRYGYRFYSEQTDLNDDFYGTGAAIASSQNPFKWGLSGDVEKSLNYNTAYDPSTGDGPGSILVDAPNRRSIIRGHLAYEKQVSEKISIVPGVNAQHYFQEFQDSSTAEWQIYNASVRLQHEYSPKTQFTVEGSYSAQVNDDENGNIASVEIGAASKMSDKISWRASVGFSAANYEISGSSQGGVFNLRAVWQPTEKLSAYIFGGNDYQPGYDGGGARMVYRAGYGANWQVVERWTLGGSVLHDYQDSLGGGPASPGVGEVRHFFNAQCFFNMTEKLLLAFRASYVNDEFPEDQTVLSLSLGYKY